MASPNDLRSRATDFVTCPMCLGLLKNPKSLPCLHTFCLKCIEGHCRDNKPGDEVACPVCTQKFNVPESGVPGMVCDFFIASLVEARQRATDLALQAPCEVCMSLERDTNAAVVPVSTMYCVNCKQTLCEPCSRPHKGWKGGPHTVVPMGSQVETELIQTQGGKCDKHKDDDVRLYCFDCKINVCLMCFAEEHQQHTCRDVVVLAAEDVKQIDADLENVRARADGSKSEMSRLDEERSKFICGVEDVRYQLIKRGEELKQLIDAQVNELMLEVQSLKTETCKTIESLQKNVEMKLLAFETFSAYCCELKLKGKPCDVTRAAEYLRSRATALLQNDVKLADYWAPSIAFTPVNVQKLLDSGQNFIGRVLVPRVVHTLREAEPVFGVTSLDDELYVLLWKEKEQVEVYNTTTTPQYSLIRQLSVPGVKYLWDMTSCKHYRCLYITDCSNCCVHRVELDGSVTKLSVNNQPYGLSVTSQFTLLVTCYSDGKLLELTTEGKQLRVIDLQSDIVHPQHTIQLSNGEFIVCHGEDWDPVHRVCIVDTNGQVTQSYGGPRGSATVGQLNGPRHLAVDEAEFILVADSENERLLLLSPTLGFVRKIVSREQLNGEPLKLFLDGKRLYVADSCGVVAVQL